MKLTKTKKVLVVTSILSASALTALGVLVKRFRTKNSTPEYDFSVLEGSWKFEDPNQITIKQCKGNCISIISANKYIKHLVLDEKNSDLDTEDFVFIASDDTYVSLSVWDKSTLVYKLILDPKEIDKTEGYLAKLVEVDPPEDE